MTYKFIEHTADVKIHAENTSLEEAFTDTALALKEVISGNIVILEQEEKKIEIKGKDIQSLLYNFLEEFLFRLDAENFLFSKIAKIEIDQKEFKLKATLKGDKANNYHFTNDVKAITYNEMLVEFDEKKKIWVCEVVLDV